MTEETASRCSHRGPHPGFTCGEVDASQPYFDVRWDHEGLRRDREEQGPADPGPDTCRPVEVDGQTIRVHGTGELDRESEEALAALVRAAKEMFLLEQADVVQQVVVLYREWRRSGAPRLGESMSRWWEDARLIELGQALARRPGAVTKENDTPRQARERWALSLVGILADLDRCPHGRHEGDVCGSCGGLSTGNPHLGPGRTLGYGVYGNPIVLPLRDAKTNPAAWRTITRGTSQ